VKGGLMPENSWFIPFNLNPAVGQGERAVFSGAGGKAQQRGMIKPFQGIRPYQARPKDEGKVAHKIFGDHNTKLKNERSTAGFKFNPNVFDATMQATKVRGSSPN
jgi:hypothetical protein